MSHFYGAETRPLFDEDAQKSILMHMCKCSVLMQFVCMPPHLNVGYLTCKRNAGWNSVMDIPKGSCLFCLTFFSIYILHASTKLTRPTMSSSMCYPCICMLFGSIDILCILLSWQPRQMFASQKRSKQSYLQIECIIANTCKLRWMETILKSRFS